MLNKRINDYINFSKQSDISFAINKIKSIDFENYKKKYGLDKDPHQDWTKYMYDINSNKDAYDSMNKVCDSMEKVFPELRKLEQCDAEDLLVSDYDNILTDYYMDGAGWGGGKIDVKLPYITLTKKHSLGDWGYTDKTRVNAAIELQKSGEYPVAELEFNGYKVEIKINPSTKELVAYENGKNRKKISSIKSCFISFFNKLKNMTLKEKALSKEYMDEYLKYFDPNDPPPSGKKPYTTAELNEAFMKTMDSYIKSIRSKL